MIFVQCYFLEVADLLSKLSFKPLSMPKKLCVWNKAKIQSKHPDTLGKTIVLIDCA